MKFTIDRNTWLRGKGADVSSLLNDNGMSCCLGHFSLACGLGKEGILNKLSPKNIINITSNMSFLIINKQNSDAAFQLMDINDDIYITDAEREEALTGLFLQNGVEVEFIN